MKEATLIFFGSWKFAATFPVAILGMKMTPSETLLYINIGGIIGVVLFARFWHAIILLWNKLFTAKSKSSIYTNKSIKRIFTRRNRRIVKLKTKYGFPGIVILNPILLSIPVACFLVAKYYGNKPRNLVWLVAGQMAWSLVYTVFYFQLYQLF